VVGVSIVMRIVEVDMVDVASMMAIAITATIHITNAVVTLAVASTEMIMDIVALIATRPPGARRGTVLVARNAEVVVRNDVEMIVVPATMTERKLAPTTPPPMAKRHLPASLVNLMEAVLMKAAEKIDTVLGRWYQD